MPSQGQPLALSRHAEIWMAILPACLAQRKAGMGLIFYKLLRARAVDMDEKHSLDLLTALEAGAHAEQAFELRTLLELRGLATVGDAGSGAPAGASAGGGAPPSGGVTAPTGSAARARAAAAAPPAEAVGEPPIALDDESAPAPPPAAPPPRAPPRAPRPAAPRLGSEGQHATLLKMLTAAIKEGRLTQAIDTARRVCDLGAPPPEAQLTSLLNALFSAEQTDAALSLYAMLTRLHATGEASMDVDADDGEDGGAAAGGGASRALVLTVLDGVVNDKTHSATTAVRAVALFNDLRAATSDSTLLLTDQSGQGADAGEAGSVSDDGALAYELLRKLIKVCLKADLVDDAHDVLAYARQQHDAAEAARTKKAKGKGRGGTSGESAAPGSGAIRRMMSDVLSSSVRQGQLDRATALFHALVANGGPPTASSGAGLIDTLCARGLATDALGVLNGMADATQPLTPKMVSQVTVALTRAGLASRAFHVFEAHLEDAGGPEASLASLTADGWNVEHGLALLTKALAKQMKGRHAHRVYSTARANGLCTNYGAFGLPALALACVEGGMLSQAIGVCEDARQALLPLGVFTASALLTAVAKAKAATPQLISLLAEVAARRLTCDAPSLHAAFSSLMRTAPPTLDEAARALALAAAASKPPPPLAADSDRGKGAAARKRPAASDAHSDSSGGLDPAAAKAVRAKIPSLLHTLCEAFCGRAEEARAVRALKAMRDRGVMPTTATCVSIANACGRRHAAAPLGELSAVLLLIRTAIGPAAYAEAAQACVAAGAPPETLLGEAAPASADATDGSTSTTNAPPPPRKTSLSSGAVDAKAERAALDAVQKSQLLREREELRTRCAQLVALLGRRTRAMERLRLELPEEHMHLVDAAEHATEGGEDEDEDDGTGPNADDGDAEGAGGGGGSSSALVVRAEDEGGPRGGSFDSRSELEVRYEEMTKVARERQSALLALQKTHGETEAQCRRLTRQVAAAGLSDAMAREAENAADIDQALFGTGGSVKSKAKPPDGWPSEIEYAIPGCPPPHAYTYASFVPWRHPRPLPVVACPQLTSRIIPWWCHVAGTPTSCSGTRCPSSATSSATASPTWASSAPTASRSSSSRTRSTHAAGSAGCTQGRTSRRAPTSLITAARSRSSWGRSQTRTVRPFCSISSRRTRRACTLTSMPRGAATRGASSTTITARGRAAPMRSSGRTLM